MLRHPFIILRARLAVYACNANQTPHSCTGSNTIPGKPQCLANMLTLPRFHAHFCPPRLYCEHRPSISVRPRLPLCGYQGSGHTSTHASFICFIVALCSRFIIIMANTFCTSSIGDGPLLMTKRSTAKHCDIQYCIISFIENKFCEHLLVKISLGKH